MCAFGHLLRQGNHSPSLTACYVTPTTRYAKKLINPTVFMREILYIKWATIIEQKLRIETSLQTAPHLESGRVWKENLNHYTAHRGVLFMTTFDLASIDFNGGLSDGDRALHQLGKVC